MSDTPLRILVVDDEFGMREGCRKILASEGFEVVTAEDGAAGLEAFLANPGFAAALVDLKMPRMSGIDLVEEIRRRDEDILLLVITAYATIETAVEATKRGAYGYIPKPFTPDELLLPIRKGLEHRALAIEARRLRQENERRTREMAQAKATFVSMVAHEIKNPLAAIEGYLNLALAPTPPAPEQARAMLERALARAQALRTMVNDLMNLTAVETGRFTLRREPMDLHEAIDRAVRLHRENAERKSITLATKAKGPLPSIIADAEAVEIIISNLVDNAIKYTPSGGCVSVHAEALPESIRLTVSDTGVGLNPEEADRVFDEFFRARNAATEEVAGTGLGLSLVKRLVEMHGGEVAVQSRPGAGAAFTVAFPLPPRV